MTKTIKPAYTVEEMKDLSLADREEVFKANTSNHKLTHHLYDELMAMPYDELICLLREICDKNTLLSTRYDFLEVENRRYVFNLRFGKKKLRS